MKKSLENLYKIVQYSILLNDENLKSSGYDELDIKNMLDDNILVKEDNAYRFNDVNGLYQYVYINDLKKSAKANYFKRCLDIDFAYKPALEALLKLAIDNRDYEQIFGYLDTLMFQANRYEEIDINFYLFLLSFMTKLPNKYHNYLENLSEKDYLLLLNDPRYSDVKKSNDIRQMVLSGKFHLACNEIRKINKEQKNNELNSNVTHLIYNVRNYLDSKILKATQKRNYTELENILTEKQTNVGLDRKEFFLLRLVRKINNIISNNYVYGKYKIAAKSVYEAIDANDFSIAKELLKKELEDRGLDINKDALYLLLRDIVILKNDLVYKNRLAKKDNYKDIIALIDSVKTSLQNNDKDKAWNLLNSFLINFNCEKYTGFVLEIIDYCRATNNPTLIKPIIAIKSIINSTYEFDMEYFVNIINKSIKRQDLGAGGAAINVIKEACKLNLVSVDSKVYKEIVDWNQNYIDLQSHKGLMIMRNVTAEELPKLIGMMQSYPNVKILNIKNMVVLQYMENDFVNGDYWQNKMHNAFAVGDYQSVYDALIELLQSNVLLIGNVARMGFILESWQDNKEALDYLIIAQALSDEKGYNYDFAQDIQNINYMLLNSFNSSEELYVNNYEVFRERVLTYGENIDQVSSDMNMTLDDINIATLLLAKDCFKMKKDYLGNKLLKKFEKSSGKSEQSKALFAEICKNKKFYAYRDDDLNLKRVKM